MGTAIVQFILSSILIVIAGSFLTRFTDKISETTGWGKMFVGGLLLAGATSLPELVVDIKAIELDLPDLAVGDLLGSSLFNLLILSILDFSFPSAFKRTAFSPIFLHHSLAAVLTILLTTIVAIGITSKLDTSFFGVSLFCWLVVVVYIYGLRLIFIQSNDKAPSLTHSDHPRDRSLFKNRPLLLAFFGYVVSALVILIIAPFLIEAADRLAKESGFGHTFIGTTLVAFATSLPELVATISAFRMGAPDLALGNIFGSNAFNMILFFPLDLIYSKNLFSSVKNVHVVTALSIVATTSIAVMGQIYRKKEHSRFSEPSSEIVVLVTLLSLVLIYNLR
jgi:cation:H+ antiporter